MTMASLFDGSGGFPLAAVKAGIKPIWASEVAPFPIRVTTRRFPNMKHYGDVTKINGAEVPPVDIITFGSPCQDMSLAGARAGLEGENSSLFYEAIRIIKEMRTATNGKQPRYIVWENVYGAFSSNGGEDFRSVLTEIVRVKDTEFVAPRCEKWESSGEILADDYSVAWRGLDAQFWGVPQRRKRIFLVADFDGCGASKILFKSEVYSGDHSPRDGAGQGNPRVAVQGPVYAIENHAQDSRIKIGGGTILGLHSQMGTGGNNVPMVMMGGVNGTAPGYWNGVVENYVVRRLTPTECARLQGFPDWWCDDLVEEDPDLEFWRGVWDTWCDTNGKKHKTDSEILRWLKKPYSEAEEYKMWGNGVALPCVEFVMKGIVAWDAGKIPEDKETLPLLAWFEEESNE